jgi:hypothetical protein
LGVAREMKITVTSCSSSTSRKAKINFNFLGLKKHSPNSQQGKPFNGNFRRQSAPYHLVPVPGEFDPLSKKYVSVRSLSFSLLNPENCIRSNDSKGHCSATCKSIGRAVWLHKDVLHHLPY